jgi:2-polyprenyl-3-methyl-5-hydroxy-6-metoxy-1,4-benzoquinol methylase
MSTSNLIPQKLNRTLFPEYRAFEQVCRSGLSVVYPYISDASADPWGWKFEARWPPSYWAFGRMRALLAINDALALAPENVLEVAAGGGGLAARIATSGCRVTANDLRAELLAEEMSEYTSQDNIKVVGGNMFDLSSDEIGKFDLIIACEVIEHVAHPDQLLSHLKRLLLPRGRILLTTPNGEYGRNRLPTYAQVNDFTALEKSQFKPDADGHLFLFNAQELCELAISVGLEVERMSVWGAPTLSGHYGFRYLSGRLNVMASYYLERLTQYLPARVRKRVCFALSAIFRLPPE